MEMIPSNSYLRHFNILIFCLIFLNPFFAQSTKSTDEQNSLFNKGVKLFEEGKIQDAFEIFKDAVELGKKTDNIQLQIYSYWFLGQIKQKQNQFEEAIYYHEKGVSLAVLVGNTSAQAGGLSALGGIYINACPNYTKALDCFQVAAEIYKNQKYYFGVISAVGMAGHVYVKLGEYSLALENFLQTLKLSREHENKNWELSSLENLANLYFNCLNNTEKAALYLDQALILAKALNNRDSEIDTLRMLGRLMIATDNYDRAIEFYEKALDISIENGDKRREALFHTGLALAYHQKGNLSIAIDFNSLALAYYQNENNPDMVSLILSRLGDIYFFLGDWDNSIKFSNESLKIAEQIGNSESIAVCKYYLGRGYYYKGENLIAQEFLEGTLSDIEDHRSRIQLDDNKINFMEERKVIFDCLLMNLAQLHNKNPENNYDEKAFSFSEKSKARVLLDILNKSNVVIGKSIDDVEKNHQKSLHEDVEALSMQLIADQNEDRKIEIAEKLQSAEEKLDAFNLALRKRYPAYSSIYNFDPLSVQKIQDDLIPNNSTAIIEFYVSDSGIFQFLIKKDLFKLFVEDREANELEEQIIALRLPFEKIDNSILELKNLDLELANTLYLELITPIAPYLKDVNKLIIVPHGCLNYLPFEFLISSFKTPEAEKDVLFSEFKTSKYLIEDFSISYVPSIQILDSQILLQDHEAIFAGDILAIGDPKYAKSDDIITNGNNEISNLAGLNWADIARLEFSKKEIEEISSIFNNPKIFIDEAATKSNFISVAPFYPIIHISTHGFMNELRPMYSGLVFGYNKEKGEADTLLAHEIFNLHLNSDLVALSACQTALGQDIAKLGGEGVIGLTRAFLYAGTKSLLVSLWQVPDEATSILMSDFYSNMIQKGMSKAESLRAAKLSLMKRERKIGNRTISYSHPFFWAPFILIGDSGKLEENSSSRLRVPSSLN